jgi:MYXO-CTERM domain-containing protein
MATPVLQKGENILFVMGEQRVEAHIQIQYQGAAKKFAWVLPVPAVPTVAVGSQPLFTNLLAATVPAYELTFASSCAFGAGGNAFTGPGVVASSAAGGFEDGGGPTVVYEQSVGAFDVTVLSGGTAAEVSQWLADNGYGATAATPKLLQAYVDKSYVFVAVKLQGESGVDEIHPLVVSYPGTMPCVPLILTREAVLDDMGVRAFILGEHRVYPENYASVTLNDLQVDWRNPATSYDVAVAHAVDEAPKGHGFVTEYAGNSAVVSPFGISSPAWKSAPFTTIAPEQVVVELEDEGLAACSPATCIWNHPLVLGLLHQYLPPPAGTADDDWYPTLKAHAAEIDPNAWSASGFASDFEARIVRPGLRAVDALAHHPYLTRLFTRISPAEMTADPTFNERADLDESVLARHDANVDNGCCNLGRVTLGKRTFALDHGRWPAFPGMPFAAKITSVPAKGPPVVLTDNGAEIDLQVAAWDMGKPTVCPGGGGGGGMGGGGRTGDDPAGSGSGCACDLGATDTGGWAAFASLAALAALARRRRSSKR